ncbi:23S rRNA (uracil(747)-C(5))-methyltransferase RlmC [Nocardioides panaciterrulae]|uniref:23S rRNA (Uracil747-C5)-methyltransferase n=1 Tax=Nocardioides panaciterrulae TaxID=661492 RepID=A0A7Y9E8L0_9ACTN|nr:23S rRNA (uracil(747)-C(5))-methyltransferase RlmC [Nocardioides panaciterrulae]NYD43170.1 23S rRNA (uracil747-C5)-methyltransferase [Nocardioides panaciterrulae]
MPSDHLCAYYDSGRCRSCTLLGWPYERQLAEKQRSVEGLLSAHPGLAWLPPARSAQLGFRNKAKMVVTGTVEQPVLGILRPDGTGVDLRECPLHTPGIAAALPVLAEFVTRARLTPYDVASRAGELKHLLVTESPDGELMVRFVLRSTEAEARIRKHLPALRDRLPTLRVASLNIQPAPKAVLEGEREILLTEEQTLRMRVNGLDLHLRPQSFFQTNTAMAATLYRDARAWVAELDPGTVWDLYCGVGGFALHLAGPGRRVTGVEVSAEAVASAETTRREAGLERVELLAGDATAYALGAGTAPDLVVVNPPRRGIGPELAGWLEESAATTHVVYSSCNAQSLARDLAAMPSLVPVRARLLDMFPNTGHYEVLTLLERR